MARDACPALSFSTLVLTVRPLELAATATPVVSSPAANVRLYDPADRTAPAVVQTTCSAAAVMTHVTFGILPGPLSCPAGCGLPEKKLAGSPTVIEPCDGMSICVTNENVVAEDVTFNSTASKSCIVILTL